MPGAGIETPKTSLSLSVWVRVVLFHKGFRYLPFVCVCLIRGGWHTVGTPFGTRIGSPVARQRVKFATHDISGQTIGRRHERGVHVNVSGLYTQFTFAELDVLDDAFTLFRRD